MNFSLCQNITSWHRHIVGKMFEMGISTKMIDLTIILKFKHIHLLEVSYFIIDM